MTETVATILTTVDYYEKRLQEVEAMHTRLRNNTAGLMLGKGMPRREVYQILDMLDRLAVADLSE